MFVISREDTNNNPEFIMGHLKDLRGIRSSNTAKDIFKLFQNKDILHDKMTNFDWAMLCIAYSIAHTKIGDKTEDAPDAQGTEIPTLATCFQSEWRFWLALIANRLIENLKQSKKPTDVIEPVLLVKYINTLWHDGAVRLKARYDALYHAYPNAYDLKKKWLQELADLATKQITLRQSVADSTFTSTESQAATPVQTIPKFDLSTLLSKIGFNNIKPKPPINGVRYDIYTLQFASAKEGERFADSHSSLVSEMGCAENQVRIERCTNGSPNSYFLNVLRPESTWSSLDHAAFSISLSNIPNTMLLPVCVGANELGNAVFEDLIEAPHVLIGGTTGSGKSVCVKSIISSLTYERDYKRVQLALFDPKQVEFSPYANHPNLWNDQIYIDNIMDGLQALVAEMDDRYASLREQGVSKVTELNLAERPHFIVAIVDEMADLIDTLDGAQDLLVRLAQKSRACGIHLVLATQRPDAKTFDGRLRSNVPARIALKVLKSTESKIILDETGAENLIGKGDRLVNWGNGVKLRHGYYLS